MPFPALPAALADVRRRIAAAAARGGHGQSVTIIAVTKSFGPGAPAAAYEAGLADVGENKVQEALDKMARVTVPVRWHLIGHLQRNKVKFTDPFVLVHGMDSARLADALHAHGVSRGKPVPALLQVNVTGEATKGGYTPPDIAAEARRLRALDGLHVGGVMTMAPFDAPEPVLRAAFGGAREARSRLADAGLPATELSMGMSGDFEIAVEEGATMVRLGTILFGTRG
ncbi:MAG: YggS family pyridoxal phosphate-dependent enzyme [Gemmatimonadetes bacterium]|nr:YggS family pyridoxal phosphate-dependent enzyme [Gemmatimonadota bacterium]